MQKNNCLVAKVSGAAEPPFVRRNAFEGQRGSWSSGGFWRGWGKSRGPTKERLGRFPSPPLRRGCGEIFPFFVYRFLSAGVRMFKPSTCHPFCLLPGYDDGGLGPEAPNLHEVLFGYPFCTLGKPYRAGRAWALARKTVWDSPCLSFFQRIYIVGKDFKEVSKERGLGPC